MSSPFPFSPMRECLALHGSWSLRLGRGDLFSANKKSGLGSPVHHGLRNNQKELEDESDTGTMTSSAMPWIMCMSICATPASESCSAANMSWTELLGSLDVARVKCIVVMFPSGL